jgi:hypothetical protein
MHNLLIIVETVTTDFKETAMQASDSTVVLAHGAWAPPKSFATAFAQNASAAEQALLYALQRPIAPACITAPGVVVTLLNEVLNQI